MNAMEELGAVALSRINTLAPVLGSAASAASNTASIQAALNQGGEIRLAGSGLAYLSGTLVIGSNTKLVVSPTLTLIMAGGANASILVSAGLNRAWVSTGIALAWTSGLNATLTWPNHGLARGSYVWVRGTSGTTDSAYSGVFRVASVTDANNVVVRLRRNPNAAPSGAIQCKLADTNIYIEGGSWNYNNTGNVAAGSVPAESSACHAIIIAGAWNVAVRRVAVTDVRKYALCLGGVSKYCVNYFDAWATNSDGIKVYGPAFDGEIWNCSFDVGDDSISLQPIEAPAYSQFEFTGGGDVISTNVRNIHGKGPYDLLRLYPTGGQRLDETVLDGASGDVLVPVSITTSVPGTISYVGSVEFRNVRWNPASGNYGISIYGTVSIDRAVISGLFGEYQTGVAGNYAVYVSGATIRDLVIRDSKITGPTANTGFLLDIEGGATISNILLDSNYVVNANNIVRHDSSIASPIAYRLTRNRMSANAGMSIAGTGGAVVTLDNNNFFAGFGIGVVRTNGAPMTVFSHDNVFGAGLALTKVVGTESVTVYGGDFPADVTALARVNGSFCYNTNAAAGTLGQAGVVDCLGAAAGSWKLRGSPSLTY